MFRPTAAAAKTPMLAAMRSEYPSPSWVKGKSAAAATPAADST